MLDSRINQDFNRSIVNPQFMASQNASKPVEAEEKQGMSTAAKWAIGLGLTALAAIGISMLTKKSTVKDIERFFSVEDFVNQGNKIAETGVNGDKPRLLLKNGKKYTGKIGYRENSYQEYLDGRLINVFDDGRKIETRSYDELGNLLSIEDFNLNNKYNYNWDSTNNRVTEILRNGKIQTKYDYFNNGKLKYECYFSDVPREEYIAEYDKKSGKLIKKFFYNARKVECYENDEIIKTINRGMRNPDAGIGKNRKYYCLSDGTVDPAGKLIRQDKNSSIIWNSNNPSTEILKEDFNNLYSSLSADEINDLCYNSPLDIIDFIQKDTKEKFVFKILKPKDGARIIVGNNSKFKFQRTLGEDNIKIILNDGRSFIYNLKTKKADSQLLPNKEIEEIINELTNAGKELKEKIRIHKIEEADDIYNLIQKGYSMRGY